jgi:MFS family permease
VTTSAKLGHLSAGMRRTVAALAVPQFRTFWLGTLVFFAGTQMQIVARAFLAFELTDSNTALGGVLVAYGVPQLLFGLHGGSVADGMNKRNVLLLWQSVLTLTSAVTGVVVAAGLLQYWMLLANGLVTGIGFAFIGPARQAYIGDLVPARLMGNAVVLQQASMNGTRVFGPALAGVVLALPLIGATGVFALTTAGFLSATLVLLGLPLGAPVRRRDGRSAVQDILEGLRYVRRNRPVGVLLLMSFLVVALAFPYQGFLPSITSQAFHRGAAALGALSSLAAAGALVASLSVAALTGHRHAWKIQAAAGIAFGVALAGFGFAPSFAAGLALIFLVGAFASGFQSLNNALTMTLAEPRYYGRVQALMGLSWSVLGVVSLGLGVLADGIGIRATLALMGAAAIVSIVVLQAVARAIGAEADMHRRRAAGPPWRDEHTTGPAASPEAATATETARSAGV